MWRQDADKERREKEIFYKIEREREKREMVKVGLRR